MSGRDLKILLDWVSAPCDVRPSRSIGLQSTFVARLASREPGERALSGLFIRSCIFSDSLEAWLSTRAWLRLAIRRSCTGGREDRRTQRLYLASSVDIDRSDKSNRRTEDGERKRKRERRKRRHGSREWPNLCTNCSLPIWAHRHPAPAPPSKMRQHPSI